MKYIPTNRDFKINTKSKKKALPFPEELLN
jgi:hypothetical protein